MKNQFVNAHIIKKKNKIKIVNAHKFYDQSITLAFATNPDELALEMYMFSDLLVLRVLGHP